MDVGELVQVWRRDATQASRHAAPLPSPPSLRPLPPSVPPSVASNSWAHRRTRCPPPRRAVPQNTPAFPRRGPRCSHRGPASLLRLLTLRCFRRREAELHLSPPTPPPSHTQAGVEERGEQGGFLIFQDSFSAAAAFYCSNISHFFNTLFLMFPCFCSILVFCFFTLADFLSSFFSFLLFSLNI